MARASCDSCAKKAQRPCPGLNGQICSKCCGEKRGSAIACPPECAFLPWGYGNPERLAALLMEAAMAIEVAVGERRPDISRTLPEAWSRLGPPTDGEDRDTVELIEAMAIAIGGSVLPDADGKTSLQALIESGPPRCTNDLRLALTWMQTLTPVLLEVVGFGDDGVHRCRDLLAPETPTIAVLVPDDDPEMLSPGTWLVGWMLRTPHFYWLFGIWVQVVGELREALRAFLTEKVGGEWQQAAVRAYLGKDQRSVYSFIVSTDADAATEDFSPAYWVGTYKLRAKRSAVRNALDSSKHLLLVEDEDDYVRYLWRDEAGEEDDARGVVVLFTTELELTALPEDVVELRAFVETLLGNLVSFKSEAFLGPDEDPFFDSLDDVDDRSWDEG